MRFHNSIQQVIKTKRQKQIINIVTFVKDFGAIVYTKFNFSKHINEITFLVFRTLSSLNDKHQG